MSTDALAFKEKGNADFKERRFKEATEFFRKAESASPSDPVYPSNLSAALYELGDYQETVEAISRSWNLITSQSNSALPPKLSNRLVRTLCHGTRAGTITSDTIKTHDKVINTLELVAINSHSLEVSMMWKEWRKIEAEEGDRKQIARESRARLSRIPIFRKRLNATLEYYTIGQDSIMSLIDDWGPEDDHDFPLNLNELSMQELGDISFLFGGVGDARHVYGTLIGIHRAFAKLPSAKRSKFRAHITLLDIHPGALARDLCTLMLLNELCEMAEGSEILETEIKATIFYAYVGVVMPVYCHERLQNTIKDLKTRLSSCPPDLPSWLYVNKDLIPGLQDALDYWSTTIPRERTTSGMLNAHNITLPSRSPGTFLDNPSVAPEYRAMIESNLKEKRKHIGQMLDSLDREMLEQLGVIEPGQSLEVAMKGISQRKEELIDLMLNAELDSTVEGQMGGEKAFYKVFKVFIPPPELWDRHPGFELVKNIEYLEGTVPAKTKKQIKAHIKATWKPNPTLMDRNTMESSSWLPGPIYPDLNLDAFQAPKFIHEFVHRFGLGAQRVAGNGPLAPSYTHTAAFFGGVVDALKAMKGEVKLEFLCGELTQELSKMRFGGYEDRPESFPTVFTRAYLSNIPDYTHGTINTIIYCLPNVKTGRNSAVASSSLLNSGIWANDDEFCHTYTLLHPWDIPRYLGCQCIRSDAIMDLVILGNNTLPRPLSSLASRPELVTWLTRILLNILLPGNAGISQFRAQLPNNLAAFFGMLVYLNGVGYPSHWLGDFLSDVIEDNIVTDVAPYLGKWPIPLSEMNRRVPGRKVRLDPWRLELENILAVSFEGIPFFIPLPGDFTTDHTDISTYEGSFQLSSPHIGTFMEPFSPFDPVISLLFYKVAQGTSANELVKMLPSVLEGRKQPAPGTIYILTSQELLDFPGRKIQWKMSRARFAKMRREGWAMVVYRTETQRPFTQPILSSSWRDTVALPLEVEGLD